MDVPGGFQMYREEVRHEFDLLSSRVNALLTSQSIFAATAAIIYQSSYYCKEDCGSLTSSLETLVAGAACAIALLASFAIAIGCGVIRAWQHNGQEIVKQDASNCLDRYYLKRTQPDAWHFCSVDLFSNLLPWGFGAGWLSVIFRMHGWPRWELAVLIAAWFCAQWIFLTLAQRKTTL